MKQRLSATRVSWAIRLIEQRILQCLATTSIFDLLSDLSPSPPTPASSSSLLSCSAVATAQLDNSGDEGEDEGSIGASSSESGLKITGIEGYCTIPGTDRGLMTKAAMKENLESASMCANNARTGILMRLFKRWDFLPLCYHRTALSSFHRAAIV
jgi:hypothetical protein